jgi:hypothetical protein
MTKTPSPTKAAAAKVAASLRPTLRLDGKLWHPMPLKVGPLKRAMVGFADLQDQDNNNPAIAAQLLDLMVVTVHKALLPNYPDLTQDELEDMVGQEELGAAFGMVLRLSGAKETEPGEAGRQGR